MKVKQTRKRVMCDVCGTESDCEWTYERGAVLSHDFMVLSVFKEKDNKRVYYDLCSPDCLVALSEKLSAGL